MDEIKFNVPYISGNEELYIQQVFENDHYAGNGDFTKRVQTWLEEYFGAKRVLLTHSCTAALEMSGLLIDLGPGDEVIMPSFTFVTTASSIMRTGASPVFCEIDDNMQIDFSDAEKKVTSRTKAIVPVHYAGFSANMDVAREFCNSHGLIMIEDSAQGLGSYWGKRPLGTFGPLAAISFHETKNIHCGLGGCLVVNDESLVERAEVVWERGTNRTAFFKGLVDKYSWQELGSSFYPTEIQAAFLLAQLESMEDNHKSRGEIWAKYSELLSPLEKEGKARMIRPESHVSHNYHAVAILLQSESEADRVRVSLNERGIQAVIHYVPLHSSPMGKKLGYDEDDLPETNRLASSLIRLPIHPSVSGADVSKIVSSIEEILL